MRIHWGDSPIRSHNVLKERPRPSHSASLSWLPPPFCCGRAVLEKKPGSLRSCGGGSFLLRGILVGWLGSTEIDAGGWVASRLRCRWIPPAVWRSSLSKQPSLSSDATPLSILCFSSQLLADWSSQLYVHSSMIFVGWLRPVSIFLHASFFYILFLKVGMLPCFLSAQSTHALFEFLRCLPMVCDQWRLMRSSEWVQHI